MGSVLSCWVLMLFHQRLLNRVGATRKQHMTVALIILAIVAWPIASIVSRTYLRAKEMNARQASASLAPGFIEELQTEIGILRQENKTLGKRVDILESIATGLEPGRDVEELKELEELQQAAVRSRRRR